MESEMKSLQVLEQHVVYYNSKWHVLYLCKENKYFVSSFGDIIEISESAALNFFKSK